MIALLAQPLNFFLPLTLYHASWRQQSQLKQQIWSAALLQPHWGSYKQNCNSCNSPHGTSTCSNSFVINNVRTRERTSEEGLKSFSNLFISIYTIYVLEKLLDAEMHLWNPAYDITSFFLWLLAFVSYLGKKKLFKVSNWFCETHEISLSCLCCSYRLTEQVFLSPLIYLYYMPLVIG